MKKGFTLIELLLTISIFAILAVSIYSVFNMGITAWKKMEAILERYQNLRLLMDRMGLELRNCLDLDIKNFKKEEEEKAYDFQGKNNEMSFYTLKEERIKQIIYRLEEDPQKSQELKVGKVYLLKREEKDFLQKEESSIKETVFDLIKEMSFYYLERKEGKEDNWLENWGEEAVQAENLPTQVKIRVVFLIPTYIPKGRKADYQEINIEKYVDIITAPRRLPQ